HHDVIAELRDGEHVHGGREFALIWVDGPGGDALRVESVDDGSEDTRTVVGHAGVGEDSAEVDDVRDPQIAGAEFLADLDGDAVRNGHDPVRAEVGEAPERVPHERPGGEFLAPQYDEVRDHAAGTDERDAL